MLLLHIVEKKIMKIGYKHNRRLCFASTREVFFIVGLFPSWHYLHLYSDVSGSESTLAELEVQPGFKLSSSYREFMLFYNNDI